MGVDNTTYTTAPIKDDKVYDAGQVDLWNRWTPINATRIGKTTNVNGKKVDNANKTFNQRPVEELIKQYTDTQYETDDESAPYFYELENVDTGTKKYGLAPKGLEHRYAGQNMSQWKVNYNKRRTDAVELESLIHGNESMLKQKEVDYGFTSNTHMGKGASEIYTKSLDEVAKILTPKQKDLTTKLVGAMPNVNIVKPTTTENQSAINKLFGETLDEKLTQSNSIVRNDRQNIDMLSVSDYIPKEKITNEANLYTNQEFMNKSKNVLNAFGVDIAGKSDKEIADIMLKEQSKYGFNLPDMIYKTAQFSNKGQNIAKDWVDIGKMYQDTDISARQIGDATKAIATDPTNLLILASMGAGVPARIIGQSALKQGLNTELGRGLITGGVEGAAYATADNLLRQKMDILAGEQQSYNPLEAYGATATGMAVGGGLGGAVGKLFGGNEQELLNRELTKNVTQAPRDEQSIPVSIQPEQKQLERLMGLDQQYPEVDKTNKFSLAEDVALRQEQAKSEVKAEPKVKQKISAIEHNVVMKEQYIEEAEPKLKEKKIQFITTKGGNIVESKDVINTKKAAENIEFDVASPTPERKPIAENQEVAKVENPVKFKTEYGDEGRTFVKESSLLSYQGTADQKASLKQRPREEITDADTAVHNQMAYYDRDAELRERYGRSEAKFDERLDIPKSKAEADRLRFQIQQYKDIRDNKSLSKEVQNTARVRLNDLYNKRAELPKPPEDLATKAEQKFIDENQVERIVDRDKRNKDLNEEFKMFMKANDRNKEGFVYTPSQHIQQVFTNVVKNAKANKANVIKAIQKVQTMETAKGNKSFSVNNITPEIREKYRDEITMIENYTGALEDAVAHGKGTLNDAEFMFRARRRVDDEIKNAGDEFKSEQELEDFITDVIRKYDETGTKVTKEQVKIDMGYVSKGGKETPEAKQIRENKEKIEASKKNKILIDNLKLYQNTKKVPKFTSGQSAGKQALNTSQMRDVQRDVLSLQEIANKTSPIATNAGRKDAIKEAREFAAKKVNEANDKKLGTTGRVGLPESIIFKDSVQDVSNSMAQIVTVLLGSKRLGDFAKLTGTDVDVRSAIGNRMEDNGVVLPKDKNGDETTWKDVVKPLFMTGNYGQMEKGLVENLMKAHNMSKREATSFYKQYDKALNDILPDFKIFKDEIYKLYHKQGKVNLSWTLPDGFPVKINVAKTKDGRVRIRDNDLKINMVTDDFDTFSRAIMPRLVQSVDGYISRRLQKEDFPMIHDAAVVSKGREKELDDLYTKVMAEINDSDLLHDIMKQLGYTGKPLKDATLARADIENSPHKLGFEHRAGEADKKGTKLRKREADRQLTEEESMRDFMASKNYRQIPTGRLVDALVNEAGYNNSVLSVAREGDDVFERQTALAFQSPEYNQILALKAPDGADNKMWNKVQEEIFNEARAKLEYHPWLAKSEAVLGDRKWFSKDGRIIGQYNKTYAEIYEELYQEFLKQHNTIAQTKVIPSDKPLDKVNFRFNKNSKFTTTINGITNKETFVKNVDNIAGKTGADMLTLDEAIIKSKIDEAKTSIVKSKWQGFKTLWNIQVNATGKYEEFNLLQRMKNVFASEVDRDAEIMWKRLMKIPKAKRDDIMKLLKSNYEIIDGMTEKQADEAFRKNNTIYTIAKRHIDQGAKGLSSASEHYGAYLNNSTKIAEVYRLPKDAIPIIDQLIAIKAMDNNKTWDVINKYTSKDEDVRYVVDVMRQHRMTSEAELFIDSPEKIASGYFGEVYRGNLKINEVPVKTRIMRTDRIKDGIYTDGRGFEHEVIKEGQKSYYNKRTSWDADSKYEQGLLGAERENNKVGKKINIKDLLSEHKNIEDIYVNYFDPKGWNIDKLNPKQQKAFEKLNMKYYLDERMTARQEKYLGDLIKIGFDFADSPEGLAKKLDWMTKNRLKENKDGEFRKVAGEDIRLEAGKTDDLAHILTETVRATNQKLKERSIVFKVIDDLATNESLLFSKEPKDGFVKLTFEQLNKLPFSLRSELKYIDQELIDNLLGRNEVRLYKGTNQNLLIADRLLNNLGTMFKQNVVLKNPASYVNALLVNQTIGLSLGIRVDKMYKYQRQALVDFKEMTGLLEQLHAQKVTGKRLDKMLEARLKNNRLYQMEKKGLSTNRVQGLVGDNDLIGSMLEDNVHKWLFKPFQILNLNQGTAGGKFSLGLFSKIDTMGRYMATMKYLDDGMDMAKAVENANGLFGNMDIMVPASIELLDKYGFVPFLKWFTLVHPQLIKLAKSDPKKVLAVAVGVYVLGQETDTNLASVNPIEGMIDFVDASLPFGTVEKLQKDGLLDTTLGRAKSNVVPKYLENIYKSPLTLGAEKLRKKRLKEPKSDKAIDYRGFTQQTIEGISGRQRNETGY